MAIVRVSVEHLREATEKIAAFLLEKMGAAAGTIGPARARSSVG